LGITAGYHRLWSHKAYDAHWIVRFVLLLGGTGALEGSIKWWCGGHRIHHRHTDSRFDPYCAKKGFFYSHIGWMLIHPRPENNMRADISDLNADAMIRWQHTHYMWFGPFMAYVLPTLISGLLWGDYAGGYFFAGALRLFFVHHNTFCVNSVAHYFGDQGYDDARTPRDSIVTALLTFGEGYHNFHHEFPNDYRNGIRTLDYDPTKWLVRILSLVGLTRRLKMFPDNEIRKGQVLMAQKKVDALKAHIRWPTAVSNLPVYTWSRIREETHATASTPPRALVVIHGLVHDVTDFIAHHPGGTAILRGAIGQDATRRFTGATGVYAHSQAAANLLSNFRVGRLSDSEADSSTPSVSLTPVAAAPAVAQVLHTMSAAAASVFASN